MHRPENRVVLITGSAGGQGRAAAVPFAAQGEIVFGCNLPKKAELNAATAQLANAEGRYEFATANMWTAKDGLTAVSGVHVQSHSTVARYA